MPALCRFADPPRPLPDRIIEGELVDVLGRPGFKLLKRKDPDLCIWCFAQAFPPERRQAKLRTLFFDFDDGRLRYSEEFEDPLKFLAMADKLGVAGVASKRSQAPHQCGPQPDWSKVEDGPLEAPANAPVTIPAGFSRGRTTGKLKTQFLNLARKSRVCVDPLFNLPNGVPHHRRITISEATPDLGHTPAGNPISQIHADLPRQCDRSMPPLRQQIETRHSIAP
jgi:hypothetical protein